MMMYEPMQTNPDFGSGYEIDPEMMDYLDASGLPQSLNGLQSKDDYLAFYSRYSDIDDLDFLNICAEMDVYLKENKMSAFSNNADPTDQTHNVPELDTSVQTDNC